MSEQTRILPATEGLVVKESTFVEGELGVITKRGYRKGEPLFRVEGPSQSQPTKYSFAVALDRHIEPQRDDGVSDFGHYLNHSCDPNVIVKSVVSGSASARLDVVARRDLEPGEELAFDYASLEYEVTTNATCKCNALGCRKVIHGFKELPPHILKRYEQEGLIPDYLLALAKASGHGSLPQAAK